MWKAAIDDGGLLVSSSLGGSGGEKSLEKIDPRSRFDRVLSANWTSIRKLQMGSFWGLLLNVKILLGELRPVMVSNRGVN